MANNSGCPIKITNVEPVKLRKGRLTVARLTYSDVDGQEQTGEYVLVTPEMRSVDRAKQKHQER